MRQRVRGTRDEKLSFGGVVLLWPSAVLRTRLVIRKVMCEGVQRLVFVLLFWVRRSTRQNLLFR